VGLGRYYTEGQGTTLAVSATGRVAMATSNEGRVYGYRMDSMGVVGLGPGTNPIVGPGRGARIGAVLANIGVLSGALPNLGIGNPVDVLTVSGRTGSVLVTSGTAASGPFSGSTVLAGANANTGQLVFGGGVFVGSTLATVSIFGDALPDIGVASAGGGVLYLLSGSTYLNWVATNPATPLDLAVTADIALALPAPWGARRRGQA
jgi:hypothetical protein